MRIAVSSGDRSFQAGRVDTTLSPRWTLRRYSANQLLQSAGTDEPFNPVFVVRLPLTLSHPIGGALEDPMTADLRPGNRPPSAVDFSTYVTTWLNGASPYRGRPLQPDDARTGRTSEPVHQIGHL